MLPLESVICALKVIKNDINAGTHAHAVILHTSLSRKICKNYNEILPQDL